MKQNTDLQNIIGTSLYLIIVMLPKSHHIYTTYSIIEQLGVLGNQLNIFLLLAVVKKQEYMMILENFKKDRRQRT